jgi:hypothetical protein
MLQTAVMRSATWISCRIPFGRKHKTYNSSPYTIFNSTTTSNSQYYRLGEMIRTINHALVPASETATFVAAPSLARKVYDATVSFRQFSSTLKEIKTLYRCVLEEGISIFLMTKPWYQDAFEAFVGSVFLSSLSKPCQRK